MIAFLVRVLQIAGVLLLLSWLAVIVFAIAMLSDAESNARRGRAPGHRRSRTSTPEARIDHAALRLRDRDARIRGTIHHPFAEPVSYATLDDLMPTVIEVPDA